MGKYVHGVPASACLPAYAYLHKQPYCTAPPQCYILHVNPLRHHGSQLYSPLYLRMAGYQPLYSILLRDFAKALYLTLLLVVSRYIRV